MNVEHVQKDALTRAAGVVLERMQEELAALANSHGCEAGAQRAYLRGKYEAVTVDIWVALGLAPLMQQIDTALLLDPVVALIGRQAPVD